ncbi:lactonase family protein [Aquibacillus kalidii]|uniref:lactonase family protein n=1 Tax=Aquibacillus kalidii TaxID=2762597 RepID=UPI0016480196|nr:lactonase family protein [Aquibacillus kalidii]
MATIVGYIGTYTKAESKGVYSFELDTIAKKITDVKVAAELSNPTYVTVSEDNTFLYAVSKEGDQGGVTAFKINSSAGLDILNSQATKGSPPCHVSINQDNSQVVAANYHTTVIESYLTNEDGSVQPGVAVKHTGSGPHERQDKPHLHFSGFTPDEKYIVAIDLGTDRIITYSFANGEWTEVNVLSTKPGSGPRHITFHPNGKFAYVMTELSNEVIALNYNHEDGSFTELQYLSAIPRDFTENSQGSAIHISSDGEFVYAGNRGHNSIASYRVDKNSGELTFLEWTSTEGDWPRDFAIDPTGEFVVVANQNSNTLVLFERDKETGKLSLLQTGVEVPEAVCVKFLNN